MSSLRDRVGDPPQRPLHERKSQQDKAHNSAATEMLRQSIREFGMDWYRENLETARRART